MPERLSPSREDLAVDSSIVAQEAWRIIYHPTQNSTEDVVAAVQFLLTRINDLDFLMQVTESAEDREIMERMFLGVLQYSHFPPEPSPEVIKRN